MKIFLAVIIFSALWYGFFLLIKEETSTVQWSDKVINFHIVENGKTNIIDVVTGLRSDGTFVWKPVFKQNYTYD